MGGIPPFPSNIGVRSPHIAAVFCQLQIFFETKGTRKIIDGHQSPINPPLDPIDITFQWQEGKLPKLHNLFY